MRILLFVGKGGVGKTTISSSTAFHCAQRGYRTLVMSLDAAHSLADAFDLEVGLLDKNKGQPVEVIDNLWLQEIDVQDTIKENWSSIYNQISNVLMTTGFDEVVAEELAILPGMEEVVGLLFINRYFREKTYDVVILDCAPTGESLRFLSVPTSLDWYMKKVFKLERGLLKLARPLAKTLTDLPLPDDDVFAALESFFHKLQGVDQILQDPKVTTVRLVTNPEKMVVKETQRAFMYFSMFGLTVDAVIINRLLPDEISDPYFQQWKALQQNHTEEIEAYFKPVPTLKLYLHPKEVVGLDCLKILAEELYQEQNGAEVLHETIPYHFVKNEKEAYVALKMPFVEHKDIGLYRDEEQLIVRVANFKRHISLPRAFNGLKPVKANFEADYLHVYFI